LQDVLPLGEVGVLAAPGGTGKTWLLLQMAIGIASGTGICDFGLAGPLWRPVRPAPVLILTAEERAIDLQARLWKICQALALAGQPRAWLLEHLHIASLRGSDCLLVSREGKSMKWLRTDAADLIRKVAGEIPGVELVVVEPISRLRGGDEQDAAATSALVAYLEKLSLETGASVLTAAHVAKWARENSELTQDAIRGTSALVDGLRWACMMRGMLESEAISTGTLPEDRRGKVQIALAKSNNVVAGSNEWLEQMSSGVLRLVRMGAAPRETGDERYEVVLGRVLDFVAEHPGEHTITSLSDGMGGMDGYFRCGQKALRAILARAVEEGRLRVGKGDGRSKGMLYVGGTGAAD